MKRTIGLSILAGFIIAGCGSASDEASTGSTSAAKSNPQNVAATAAPLEMDKSPVAGGPRSGEADQAVNPKLMTANLPLQQRAVVRNASLQIRVESVEAAEKKLDAAIESLHGYVDSVTSSDLASDKPVLTVKARIPAENFAKAMEQFETLGVRLAKSVHPEDVTEKLVDMDARLKTMIAQEDTYRGMLREQHNMSNMVQLQQQLMELRSQIESIAAQRKSLSGVAALSTIDVTLQQKSDAVAAAHNNSTSLGEAWSDAWTAATSFFRTALVAVFWVLAFSPVWLIALGGAIYVRRATARTRNA